MVKSYVTDGVPKELMRASFKSCRVKYFFMERSEEESTLVQMIDLSKYAQPEEEELKSSEKI